MKNKVYDKKEFWLSIFVILLPIIYGAINYSILPNQLAIHFEINGTPDNYVNKALVVFGFPILMAFFQIFMLLFGNHDLKNQSLNKKIRHLIVWLIPIINSVVYLATIEYALNNMTDIRRIIVALIGLLFVVLGNYIPTVPSNYSSGVFHLGTRNVLTAQNKYLQRYYGYIFVISGTLMLVSLFFSPMTSMVVTSIAIVIIIIYSIFVFFKTK